MPSRPSWSRGFRAFTGLSFNLNFQSRLKLHSEVVLPDDDSLEPAHLETFDETLVKRWLERIIVWEDHFTVELKSGLKIEIKG